MTLRTMTPAGTMALGAATLVAATGPATTAAGSDSLFQLLQFKIDMFHWYSPPSFSGAGNGHKRLAEPPVRPRKMIFWRRCNRNASEAGWALLPQERYAYTAPTESLG